MLFPSIIFMAYFLPVVLAGNRLLRSSRGLRNIWLLLASLFFYAWGEPIFVFFIIFSVLINYMALIAIGGMKNGRARLLFTFAACAFNLAVLFLCKQLAQIVIGVGYFLAPGVEITPYMTVPIGLSFFTLRTLSLTIDVYRGTADTPKNPLDAALYISFFPTFIAGPLMSFSDMEEQIHNRRGSRQAFSSGVCRFIAGLAKKTLIANNMAAIADHVFSYSAMSNEIMRVPATLAWLGAAAFVLQIYFDLSGYSDMAIGLGGMLGFELNDNFDYPYASLSLSEFWDKWNITLTNWFKEYVYTALGGQNVKNNDKMVRNICIMWLLMGLFHGAKWTFVLWGLWQFCFLVFERLIAFEERGIAKLLRRVYVLIIVLFGFVIFRAEDIYQATLFFSNMFGLNHNGFFSETALMFVREYWLFIAAGILFSTPAVKTVYVAIEEHGGEWSDVLSFVFPVLMTAVFYIAVLYIIRGGGYPFIYFRF